MSAADLPAGPRFNPIDGLSFIHWPRRYYARLRRRFGDIVTLRPPRIVLVLALSSEGAREVLGADAEGFGAFQKEAFGGIAGQGSLWVLERERHRSERRLLLPSFHHSHFRVYVQLMQQSVLQFTNQWRSGATVRAYDTMLDISRDIILRTVLGLQDQPLIQEGHDVVRNLLRAIHPWISFTAQFQSWWFWPWVRYRRAHQQFSAFVTRCLEQRRAQDRESVDVLGAMLAAVHENGTPMRDEEIRDELLTILLSGHETTAVALSWALYELGRHPAVLARLRDELDALGPEPDVLVKQPYLSAVCDETLRLHTILTEIARTTVDPLPLLGYRIPPGVGVGVSISAIHQDPRIYPEPDRFIPERFFNRAYSPFEFLPFGGGNRRCLGAAFSDYEMRLGLAMVVMRWDFETVSQEREVRHNIAMGPRNGVSIRLKRRRDLSGAR